MNIDNLPGYYKDPNGNDRGGMRAMFIGGDCTLYNDSHVTMFEYLASPPARRSPLSFLCGEHYKDAEKRIDSGMHRCVARCSSSSA